MNGSHWTVLILVLVALFTQTAGLDHWSDFLNPKFLSGTMLMILAVLRALLIEKVGGRSVWSDTERAAYKNELGV